MSDVRAILALLVGIPACVTPLSTIHFRKAEEAAHRGQHDVAAANYAAALAESPGEHHTSERRAMTAEAKLVLDKALESVTGETDVVKALQIAVSVKQMTRERAFDEVDTSALVAAIAELATRFMTPLIAAAEADRDAGHEKREVELALALQAVAVYPLELAPATIERRLAPFQRAAVRAWIPIELARARDDGAADVEVELGRLVGIRDVLRANKLDQVAHDEIDPLLDGVAERGAGDLSAIAPAALARTIARVERLVTPLQPAAALRKKLATLEAQAAAIHTTLAGQLDGHPGAQDLHWELAARYGAAADPRSAAAEVKLASQAGLDWTVTAAGEPCPTAKPTSSAITARAGGLPMAATITFAQCTSTVRNWTERQTTKKEVEHVHRGPGASHCRDVGGPDAYTQNQVCTSDPDVETISRSMEDVTEDVPHSETKLVFEATAHLVGGGSTEDVPIHFAKTGSAAEVADGASQEVTQALIDAAAPAIAARRDSFVDAAARALAANDVATAEDNYALAAFVVSPAMMPTEGATYLIARYGLPDAEGFRALSGRAEVGRLPDGSIALVTTAFEHTFRGELHFGLPAAYEPPPEKAPSRPFVGGEDHRAPRFTAIDGRLASMSSNASQIPGATIPMVGLHVVRTHPAEDNGFGLALQADVAIGSSGRGVSMDGTFGAGLALHAGIVTLMALFDVGGDGYSGGTAQAYTIPFAYSRSYALRMHLDVWAPWTIEGGIIEVVRSADHPTGPDMRPAGAPAAVDARSEFRADLRLFRKAWFAGIESMSTQDGGWFAVELGSRL